MSLFDIYKATKLCAGISSLFDAKVGGKLNKDAWKKGFNKWNEEYETGSIYMGTGGDSSTAGYYRSKYFRVVPSTTYYMKCPTAMSVFFYNEKEEYLGDDYLAAPYNSTFTTPQNVSFMRFRNSVANTWIPYQNNICVNISGEHDGEYVPYNG